MNVKKIGTIAVIIVVVGLVITFASGAVNTGAKAPNVKFVAFSPEGKQTLKQDQSFLINFRVHNYEPKDIDNARIVTTFSGDSRYFGIDRPDFVISPPIGASNGESGDQKIQVRAGELGDQLAIESKFTLTLYVGLDITDKREVDVRIEK